MDELVEKLCTLLAEHALDGDGPADGAMRDALQKSGVADLVKDAERYRWLRKKTCIISKPGFMSGDTYAAFEILDMPFPTHVAPRPDIELDAAIDAAMKGANA